MQTPVESPSQSAGRWTNRRLVLFVLSLSPFIALFVLLAWGQVRSGGNPGGLLEHNESGEVSVASRSAPPLKGVDLVSGQFIDASSFRGKVVMVDFWSSWCVACAIEARDIAEVYREYAGLPVEFVGLAIWDEVGDSLRYLDRHGVTFPNIIDERGRTAVLYGVRGVPEKFFLDTEGNVVRKVIGPVSKEELREIIDSLLAS